MIANDKISVSSYVALYVSCKNLFFLAFPVMVVFGNAEFWLGSSSLTIPWVLVFLLPVGLIELLRILHRGRCEIRSLFFIFLYVLLLGFGVLSALVGSETSFKRNFVSLLPFFIALLTLFSFSGLRAPSNVARLMCLAGGLLSLLVLYKSLFIFLSVWSDSGISGFFAKKSEMGLPLGQSNFLAVLLVFFSIFAWSSHKLLWIFMLVATCLTMSRFGVVFFLLAAVCVWLLGYLRLLTVVALLGLVGGGAVLLFLVLVPWLLQGVILPASLQARFELWGAAIDLLNARPFWGGGPGGFTTYLELIAWPRYEWGVHNFVLSQWIQFGVLGLTVYAVIILRLIFVRSSMQSADEALIKLGGVILLFYGLVENVVGVASFEIMFAYLLCLLSARVVPKVA